MAKTKNKEKYIYCVFCGNKNEIDRDNCIKCNKDLHPKDTLFRDFLYNHIKTDLKGKVKENIFSYLKNFIISHLYGSAMCFSVVFTTIVLVSTIKPYKMVSSIDDIKKTSNSNEIVVRVYTYDDSCASDFDSELIDIPFTSAGTISGLKRLVTSIKVSKGSNINDWCNIEHSDELICNEEVYIYDSKIDKVAIKYREKVLEYAKWVRENGINDSNEYAKWNRELNELSNNIFTYDALDEYDKNKQINKSIDLYVSDIGCLYEEG